MIDEAYLAEREEAKEVCEFSFSKYCKRVCPADEFCSLKSSYKLKYETVN